MPVLKLSTSVDRSCSLNRSRKAVSSREWRTGGLNWCRCIAKLGCLVTFEQVGAEGGVQGESCYPDDRERSFGLGLFQVSGLMAWCAVVLVLI